MNKNIDAGCTTLPLHSLPHTAGRIGHTLHRMPVQSAMQHTDKDASANAQREYQWSGRHADDSLVCATVL